MARKSNHRPIWTVDAETDPFKKGRIPVPFIWGCYTGEEYHQFDETEKLIEFLRDKNVVVYGHNAGKFDWHFITQYIETFEPLTVIAGRLAKFKIGECEFRDSFNLIPAPLSAYKKDDFDYRILEVSERDKPHNRRKIEEYLKADCVYLHEMVTEFINDYGMNLTQAGSAMKFWAKLTKQTAPKTAKWYYDILAPFYYGGRTECFIRGVMEHDFHVIDINSAYSFAMTHEHPWGSRYNVNVTIPDEATDDDICRAFLSIKARGMGAFPLRGEHGLSFPNDGLMHEFFITGWEYIAARDTGALQDCEVKEYIDFLETVSFTDYVEHFFKMKNDAKEAGDKARYLFAKIFLNSLYGKFASNPENYQEFMTVPGEFINASCETQGWFYCKMIDDDTAVVNRPLPEENHRYYDVAVAASITGFVRAYLWRHISKCDGVMYCDTDSIACTGYSDTVIGDELGQWSHEAQCDYAAIAGKKLYAFRVKNNGGWKTASKGVRLTPDEIIEVAKGGTVINEPEVPTFTIKGDIRFTPRKIRMT